MHRAGSTGAAVAAAQEAVGTLGNPVTNVAISGGKLVVTFDDGTTRDDPLPPGMTTGDGTDQTARDAAAAAQADIDVHEATPHNTDTTARTAAAAAQAEIDAHEATPHNTDTVARSTATNARTTAEQAQAGLAAHEAAPHNTDTTARSAAAAAQSAADAAQSTATANADQLVPPSPTEAANGTATTIRGWSAKLIRTAARAILPGRDEVVDVENGRLPGPPVVMRLGWSQSRAFTESHFDRPLPPIGGSVTGASDGLAAPPFPPALASDPTLFLGIWLAGDPDIAELPADSPLPTSARSRLTARRGSILYRPRGCRRPWRATCSRCFSSGNAL